MTTGYRSAATALPKFNIAVLDIDDGVTIDTVKLLLHDYTYFIYTTKSHTDKLNKFRVILPLSHVLSMTSDDHREFMENIYEWLPFDVDRATKDIARKWRCNAGSVFKNQGKLLNALLFIPKTSKNEQRKANQADYPSLNGLERWMVMNSTSGGRNNHLLKYAYFLVDSGHDFPSIQNHVLGLNNKLKEPLPETEILSTIMSSVQRKIHDRDLGVK